MTLKTDKRYIAAQSLKAIVGYILGISLVLFFLDLKHPYEVIITSILVGIILFYIYFLPREISVKRGIIRFRKENSIKIFNLALTEIAKVETKCKYYNTIILTTKSGEKYKLHPKDVQSIEKIIQSGK